MRCRATIGRPAMLPDREPLSVHAPPRLVGAFSPCKFRGLARKRPYPAAPIRPPAGGPQRRSERGERARSRGPCGPLAFCVCACCHRLGRAERRIGPPISAAIPTARAFCPAAGCGGGQTPIRAAEHSRPATGVYISSAFGGRASCRACRRPSTASRPSSRPWPPSSRAVSRAGRGSCGDRPCRPRVWRPAARLTGRIC